MVLAVAILSIATAVYFKNKITKFNELDTSVGKKINIAGYMSPIMKEDFTFMYLQNTPYDYDITDKTVGVYLRNSYGYYTGLVTVNGYLKKASEEDFDTVKVNISGETGYIEKDKLTDEKKKLISKNNVKCEYLYTDGSTNTFKYKIEDADIKTYDGNEYKVEDTILTQGYTDLVNGLLQEVYERINGTEAKTDGTGHADEIASESNLEHGINTSNAAVLAEYIRSKTKYKELADILNETVNIYNKAKEEGLKEENKKDVNKEAEELYSRFIESLKSLAVE